jgi:hypothetical protein
MLELWVNDTQIPLAPGERIILQKAPGRIGTFSTRGGEFSNDFEVVIGNENGPTLGHVGSIPFSGDYPYRQQPAELRQQGAVIAEGFVQLVSVDQVARRAKVSFFGSNIAWFSLIGDGSIRDLDFTDLNHNWTLAEIAGSWPGTGGYVYPMIDPGYWNDLSFANTEITDWRPAVFLREIIGRIFDRIGYRLAGDFLAQFAYQNAIVPVVRMVDGPGANNQVYGIGPAQQLSFLSASGAAGSQSQNIELTATNSGADFSLANDTWVSGTTGTVFLEIEAAFEIVAWINSHGSTAPLTMTLDVVIQLNGADHATTTLAQTINTNTAPGLLNHNFNTGVGVAVVPGDEVRTVLRFSWTGFTGISQAAVSVRTTGYRVATAIVETDANLQPGQGVDIAYNLPDIKQRDLVRDFFIRHALVPDTNYRTRTVSITPFRDIYHARRAAPDLSAIVSRGRVSEIDYTELVKGYFQRLWFRYAPDDDDEYLSEYDRAHTVPYGALSVDLGNDFLPPEGDFYQSPFAPTRQIRSFVNTGSYSWAPVIPSVEYDGSPRESEPRILYYQGEAEIFRYGTRGAITIDGTSYTTVGHAYFARPALGATIDAYREGLHWGDVDYSPTGTVSLTSRWYEELISILRRPVYLKVEVILLPHEYHQLDFLQPVYLNVEGLSGHFVIDEVAEYNGRTAALYLIKIP